jgi:alpha-glucosidase
MISRGRDGCRVPLPWAGDAAPYGFSPGPVRTWLPQPDDWGIYSVERQAGDPGSMLELYRKAMRMRRSLPALGDGSMQWLSMPDGALGFAREPGFLCVVNYTAEPVALPPDAEVLLASDEFEFGAGVPADTTVWLDVVGSAGR